MLRIVYLSIYPSMLWIVLPFVYVIHFLWTALGIVEFHKTMERYKYLLKSSFDLLCVLGIDEADISVQVH